MARTPILVLALLICAGPLPADEAARQPVEPAPTPAPPAYPQGPALVSDPMLRPAPGQARELPWLDEVRAQRRALNDRRRAEHDARRHARDPVGAAQQDARMDEFMRRRQELRELMLSERWLFRNRGPWFDPLIPPFDPAAGLPGGGAEDAADAARPHPPGWDNRWYYNGW